MSLPDCMYDYRYRNGALMHEECVDEYEDEEYEEDD